MAARVVIGAFPGSFNPPTLAHLAIADSARQRYALERLDLVVSRVALGKEDLAVPTLEDRLAVLRAVAAARPGLGVRVTDAQLLADVAAGYDLLVVGADKWAQLVDPAWYGGSAEARDAALARLPKVAVVPRPPAPVPDDLRVEVLDAGDTVRAVSSTAVRQGRRDWMAPEAAAFDEETGAWSDPERYRRAQA